MSAFDTVGVSRVQPLLPCPVRAEVRPPPETSPVISDCFGGRSAGPPFFWLTVFLTTGVFVPALGAQRAPDFTAIAEANAPAVVNIGTPDAMRPVQSPEGLDLDDIPSDSPFYEYFRRFADIPGNGRAVRPLGSGFVISPDGYIITNRHVVKGAETIVVRLGDRRELDAELIGADEPSDLALLKIQASDLPIVRISRDSELAVGQWVVAIGSPFGFERSVTAGIVSARGRGLPRASYIPFIQTDVAINVGSSGGPLLNLDGEVVGVNSALFTDPRGYMGVSFAIPIRVAMDVADQLKATGRVARGWLGAQIQDVDRGLAESFGMAKPAGALISGVLPDGPADTAKLAAGDIVLSFAGRAVERATDLPPLVGLARPGSHVALTVLRGGEQQTLEVTLGELPTESPRADASSTKRTETAALGLTVVDLTDAERGELGLQDLGVRVVAVKDGPAARAGIRAGDLILMLDKREIRTAAEFARIAGGIPADRPVAVLVQRAGNPLFLALGASGGAP